MKVFFLLLLPLFAIAQPSQEQLERQPDFTSFDQFGKEVVSFLTK